MFKPKKHVRLQTLNQVPLVDDLRVALKEASKARGCTIELPWTMSTGVPFSLTVRVELAGGDPMWTLYEGQGGKSRVVWSSPFEDPELLHDVLLLSVPEDTGAGLRRQRDERASSHSSRAMPHEGEAPELLTGAEVIDSSGYAYRHPATEVPSSTNNADSEFAESFRKEMELERKSLETASQNSAQKLHSVDDTGQQSFPAINPAQPQAQTSNADNPYNTGAHPIPGYPYPPAYGYPPGYPYPPGYAYPPGYHYPPGYPYYPMPGAPPQSMPQDQAMTIPQGGQPLAVNPAGAQASTPLSSQPGNSSSSGSPSAPRAATVPVMPGSFAGEPEVQERRPTSELTPPRDRPNMRLGQFLVEAGLVPETTVDAALQLQELVRSGSLSTSKAAEAVRRAHVRGGAVDPKLISAPLSKDSVDFVAAPLGQILVEAAVIRGPIVRQALRLQEKIRSSEMTREEAIDALCFEAFGVTRKEQEKGGETQTSAKAMELLLKAQLVSEFDHDTASKVRDKRGGRLVNILVKAGKLDQHAAEAAFACNRMIAAGKLKEEQAIIALHFCQRSRVDLKEALSDLGWVT